MNNTLQITIGGFSAEEWYTIKLALVREIESLDNALSAVVDEGLIKQFDEKREKYIRLACMANKHYLMCGGR